METVELRANLKTADMKLKLTLIRGACLLLIADTAEKVQVLVTCTPEQAAAIWFLAISGDEYTSELIGDMYKIASPICDELPNNLRPIP